MKDPRHYEDFFNLGASCRAAAGPGYTLQFLNK